MIYALIGVLILFSCNTLSFLLTSNRQIGCFTKEEKHKHNGHVLKRPMVLYASALYANNEEVGSSSITPESDTTEPNGPSADEQRQKIKNEILRYSIGTNRGLIASKAESDEIGTALSEIEQLNPNPRPNCGLFNGTSPLIGRWKLLYTDAPDVTKLTLIPGVTIGQIYQNIGVDDTEIENIVELQPLFSTFLPVTVARVVLKAKCAIESPSRLSFSFESAEFDPIKFWGKKVDEVLEPIKYKFSEKRQRKGFIENSYVDEDMRVVRGYGKYFILIRAS